MFYGDHTHALAQAPEHTHAHTLANVHTPGQASDLCEDEGLGAAAVQAQDEADGLEELVDAGPELVLLHPTGGSRVQDPRLHNELEQVLQRLSQKQEHPFHLRPSSDQEHRSGQDEQFRASTDTTESDTD